MAYVLSRALQRNFSVSATRSYVAGPSAVAGDHSGGYKIWKRLSLFVALPAVALCMLNAYLKHQEDHHKPRQEFIPYEYLRVRNKRFPWGDGTKSLFHNPHTNPLPGGYEE